MDISSGGTGTFQFFHELKSIPIAIREGDHLHHAQFLTISYLYLPNSGLLTMLLRSECFKQKIRIWN